jgi:hypothetical protein
MQTMCGPDEPQPYPVRNFTYRTEQVRATEVKMEIVYKGLYEGGSKSFRPDIQKTRQMENAARDIYSANYGEINVSVSGGYVLQYAGGTCASSCFISVTLKSWSGWKLLDPTTYIIYNTSLHESH